LAGIVLLLAGLFGLAQTGFGKRQLAILISRSVSSSPSARVEVEHLEGWIPWKMHTGRVQIRDEKGVWLEAEDLTFHVSLQALLRGRIHILEAGIKSARVIRPPISSPRGAPSRFTLPSWPPPIPPLLLDYLHLERCVLEADLFGEPMVLSLKGEIRPRVDLKGIGGRLIVTRMDRPGSMTHIMWTMQGDPPILTVEARMEEPRGGLLLSLLGMQEAPPMTLTLRGQGPLRQWKGRMSFWGEGMGRLDAALRLRMGQELSLTTEGRWEIAKHILPGSVEALAQSTQGTFSLDLSYGKERLLLKAFRVEAENMNFSAQGEWRLTEGGPRGRFAGALRDLAPIGRDGKGSVQGTFWITREAQKADVSFWVETGRRNRSWVKRLSGEARILRQRNEEREGAPIYMEVEGRLQGLSREESVPAPILGGSLDWSMAARWTPGGTAIISRLEVEAEALKVEFAGEVNPALPRAQGRLRARLSDPSVWFGRPLSAFRGPVEIRAELEVLRETKPWIVKIHEGYMRWTSQSPVHALLGPELGFSGNAEWGPGSILSLSPLRLQAADIRAKGQIALDLGKGEIHGTGRVEVPDLTPLAARFGQLIKGKTTMDLEVQGPLKEPGGHVRILGQDVLWGGLLLDEVSAEIKVENLSPIPQARLALLVRVRDQSVRGRAHLALHGGETLSIDNLSLQSQQARLLGDLKISLRDGSVSGRITGSLSDLSFLGSSPFLEIQGPVRLKAEFRPHKEGQGLRMRAQGHDLVNPWGRIKSWAIDLHMDDVWGDRTAMGRVRVSAVRIGELSIQKGSLDVKGGMKNMFLSLRAEGQWNGTFGVQAQSLVEEISTLKRVEIRAFQGHYEGIPFTLVAPVSLKRSKEGFSLEKLDLKIGDGSVSATASFLSGKARLDLHWEGLSMEPLGRHLGRDLSGRVHGNLKFHGGALSRSEARAEIRITDLRIPSDTSHEVPPVRILSRCWLEGKSLWFKFALEGLGDYPFKGDVRLPLFFSLTPFAIDLRSEGKIQGRMAGVLNLGLLPPILHPLDQRMEGLLRVDLRLTGSLEDPNLEGTLSLDNGRWEPQTQALGSPKTTLSMSLKGERPPVSRTKALPNSPSETLMKTGGKMGMVEQKGKPTPTELNDWSLS